MFKKIYRFFKVKIICYMLLAYIMHVVQLNLIQISEVLAKYNKINTMQLKYEYITNYIKYEQTY